MTSTSEYDFLFNQKRVSKNFRSANFLIKKTHFFFTYNIMEAKFKARHNHSDNKSQFVKALFVFV